ncbi:MAG: hypothetical protein QN193_05040 [Armatimonadota bacterium]|nr:hypothetical protein [Armatimonadota bacterium]MDR7443287.1 hypothetical protein [Armatimonadota bacterium]MDR7569954.1 hypothetical protein [Armatimonadota bacterium]MDR7614383.1 hypothetical protein [Armatimonadota bacterium]
MEVLLVSNGPGELWGWALPVARALRRVGGVTVRLGLLPCQYATGREAEVARRTGLFEEVLDPGSCVRLSLGVGSLRVDGVVHLGGDLWYAVRFGRRARCPVFAYTERTLIASRHRAFVWIGTPTEGVARRLVALGVPEGKVEAVGELRVDALAAGLSPEEGDDLAERDRLLLLLPGSRPSLVRDLAPVMARIGELVRRVHRDVEVAMAASPFLPPGLLEGLLPDRGIRILPEEERLRAYRRAALALTIPGSSNLELAYLHTPMVVWLPLYDPARLPLEGLLEWVGRIPLAGRALKAAAVRRHFRTPRLVALPNRLAGARIVEEVVGDAPVEVVVQRVVDLLRDGARRARMQQALRAHFPYAPGAAERIARRIAERIA